MFPPNGSETWRLTYTSQLERVFFINNNVWTAVGRANGAAGEIAHMQWGQLPGAERRPALPPVVYVRIHNFRGKQFFRELSVIVNGKTI